MKGGVFNLYKKNTMVDRYIEMRNKAEFDLNWFFSYYVENGGTYDYNTFISMFTLNTDMLKHLDYIFELTVIEYVDGRFIKVIK